MHFDQRILIDNIDRSNYGTNSTIVCKNITGSICHYCCSSSTIGSEASSHTTECEQLSKDDIATHIKSYVKEFNLLDVDPFEIVSAAESLEVTASTKTTRKRHKTVDNQCSTTSSQSIDDAYDDTIIMSETVASTYSDTSSSSSFSLKAKTSNADTLFRQLHEKLRNAEKSIKRVTIICIITTIIIIIIHYYHY